MKLRRKQGKTGEKSQDPAKFAPPNSLVRNSHHSTPWCEIAFVSIFQKACSRSPSKISVRKCTVMRTLCEIAFVSIFPKAWSRSQKITGMRKFSHFTIHLVRNSHFLFLKSKLVLFQSSQHLFSDHSFPSTRSSPSSSPILNSPHGRPSQELHTIAATFTIHNSPCLPFLALSPPSTIKNPSFLH